MKRFSLILLLVIAASSLRAAQPADDGQQAHDRKMEWWREAKFGMFIHWGPYAVLGGVYNGHQTKRWGSAWIMNICKIPVAEYQAAAARFNPTEYDPESWVLLAKAAGMKYIVITAKHHDGFAMFRTAASPFNIVDHTPYGKDPLVPLAEACRKHGIRLGIYYSHSQDWNNPGGGTVYKPLWGWDNPDSTRINAYAQAHEGSWDPAQQTRTRAEYIDRVAVPQVKELMSNYGDVAVFWWDTPKGVTDEEAAKFSAVFDVHPATIHNDRLRRPNKGDYKTPEGFVPKPGEVEGIDWESCMTIGSSWGYKSWERNTKPARTLIRNLISSAARGGNFLLNVGPDDLGRIPEPQVERLKAMGAWMKTNGEAIYGTQRSGMSPEWGEITRKDGRDNTTLYLCVFDWPVDGRLIVETKYPVKKASLLHDGRQLKATNAKFGWLVSLPAAAPDADATVIKVELDGKMPATQLTAYDSEKSFEIPGN